MPIVTAELLPLKVVLGADDSGEFEVGLPVLAGEVIENLFGDARAAGRAGVLKMFHAEGWLLGAATVPLTHGLEEVSRRLYEDLFQATRGQHLARIWNYVPAINELGADGLEHYRAFCRGRSLAFEQNFGSEYLAGLPSASAVGSKTAALTVIFAACATLPRHVENPWQVPAYHYPGEYGPRAPSFARATVVPGLAGATVFISGTAAIRGHATVAPDRTAEQLECALENLRGISAACGIGPELDAGGTSARHFKVYLRHASDQAAIAAVLERELFTGADRVSYLQADICRAALFVEIEASLFGVGRVF